MFRKVLKHMELDLDIFKCKPEEYQVHLSACWETYLFQRRLTDVLDLILLIIFLWEKSCLQLPFCFKY